MVWLFAFVLLNPSDSLMKILFLFVKADFFLLIPKFTRFINYFFSSYKLVYYFLEGLRLGLVFS